MGATIEAQEKTDVVFYMKKDGERQFTIRVRQDIWPIEEGEPVIPRKTRVIAKHYQAENHQVSFHTRYWMGPGYKPGADLVGEMVQWYQCKCFDNRGGKALGDILHELSVEFPALQAQFQKDKEVFKTVNYRTLPHWEIDQILFHVSHRR